MTARESNIDVLRILAAFTVVVLHVASPIVDNSANFVTDSGLSPIWWTANVYISLCRWCVPVFVLISGALLLARPSHTDIPAFYRKRASRILYPMIAWTAFFLGWRCLQQQHLTVKDIASAVIYGSPYYHLWYLYMLAGLYLATPFLSLIVTQISRNTLIGLILFLFAAASANSLLAAVYGEGKQTFLFKWMPFTGYYLSGYLIYHKLQRQNTSVTSILCPLVFLLSTAGIAIFTGALVHRLGGDAWKIMYTPLNPLGILQALSLFYLLLSLPHLRSPKALGIIAAVADLTFGIYLIHPVFLGELPRLGISAQSFQMPWIAIPLMGTLAFILSAVTARLISHVPIARRTI